MNNQAANDCNIEPVACEFFILVFVLHDDEVTVIVCQSVSKCGIYSRIVYFTS